MFDEELVLFEVSELVVMMSLELLMGCSEDCSELIAVGVELDDSVLASGKLEELDIIRSVPCSLDKDCIKELEERLSVDGADDVGSILPLL